MGVEEITVPARFLTTVAHLVATLTIVYDVVREVLLLCCGSHFFVLLLSSPALSTLHASIIDHRSA